jgi:hypothetical protein
MSAANIAVLVLCPFHNPDLFFSQPVKLVDQGVYLARPFHIDEEIVGPIRRELKELRMIVKKEGNR